MKTKQQLSKDCQAACAARLPGWQKYRSYGLYRRTEDFVQWLFFGVSDYEVQVIPSYGIQPLAIQFPTGTISLGGRVPNSRGADYWISPEEWVAHQPKLVEHILNQIAPSVVEPLSIDSIITFLELFKERDELGMVSYGIATVVAGEFTKGLSYLEKAMTVYERSRLDWSKATAQRLKSWLAYSSDELLAQLRQDAVVGGTILGLKEP